MGKMIDKLKEDLSVLDRHLARQDEEIAELKTTNADLLAALKEAESTLKDIIGASDNNQPYTREELQGFALDTYNKVYAAIAAAKS